MGSYEDLGQRFKRAHDRVKEAIEGFPDKFVQELPLVLGDAEVNDVAVAQGWKDEFLKPVCVAKAGPPPTAEFFAVRRGGAVPVLPPIPAAAPARDTSSASIASIASIAPIAVTSKAAPPAPAAEDATDGDAVVTAPADGEGPPICLICQQEMTNDVEKKILGCGHTYHLSCMEGWYTATSNFEERCPLRCNLSPTPLPPPHVRRADDIVDFM